MKSPLSIRVFLCLIALLLALPAAAQDAPEPLEGVRLAPSRTEAEIGEPIDVRLEIPAGMTISEASVSFPENQSHALLIGPVNRGADGAWRFTLRVLREPEGSLGPAEIALRPEGSDQTLTIESNRLELTINPPEGEADFLVADFTGPLALPFNFFMRNLVYFIAGFLLLAAAVAAGIMLLLWMQKRRVAATIEHPLPPVESALHAVDDLSTLDIYRRFGPERHYTSLSNIIRGYLERQFGHPALEMTEDEVVALLQSGMPSVTPSEALADVLRRSSMAKFARMALTEDIARGDCRLAASFFTSERMRLREEELMRQLERREASRPAGGGEERAA